MVAIPSAALIAMAVPQQTALAIEAAANTAFDGTWLYTKDSSEGVAIAFEIRGSSMIYLSKEGDLVTFARGWWTVNPYANPDAQGIFHVKTEVYESAVVDGPEYEEEAIDVEVRMIGPDRAELSLAGESVRRGVMERIACVPAVHYVDRSDSPPEGCKWSEVRGLGYDGLTGDCRWDEDWADNWEAISRDPEGQPWPAACLISEPVQFP
jgi:hypothetical protein